MILFVVLLKNDIFAVLSSHGKDLASIDVQDILQFFRKFNDSVGKDLQFVIDDLSTKDSTAVGATWHLGMWMEIILLFHI